MTVVITEVIHKITIPFGARHMLFEVPANAELVHVDRDTREPATAALWYKFTEQLDDGFGEMPTKSWTLCVVATGESFVAGCEHLGTILVHDTAWHVLDLAPLRG